MSLQAMAWVLQDAPGVKPHWAMTLMGLVNHADEDGDTYPSQKKLARYTRKDTRAVREDLRALEGAKLIRKSPNQAKTAHLPRDKRPVVWVLAVELKQDPEPEAAKGGRPAKNREGLQTLPVSENREGLENRPDLQTLPVSGNPSQNREGLENPPVPETLRINEVELKELKEEENAAAALGNQTEPTTELTPDEEILVKEVQRVAPRFSRPHIEAVLMEPVIRSRDIELVRVAFPLCAADEDTVSLRRLLKDSCPHWAAAERELRNPSPGAIGAVPWCGDPGCDPVTRTAVDAESGRPLYGNPRCPRCHPNSPAAGVP